MAEPVLTLQHISHRYPAKEGELCILNDISLSLKQGQSMALVGPSGAGKTTLLQIAGLLMPPSAGQITIAGIQAEQAGDATRTRLRREHIGFIYQFHHLLPEFSALDNVLMPLRIAGTLSKQGRMRAERLLERIGLAERISHRPAELSGGERQRVAIARALIHKPALILADEPTGNLDEAHAMDVAELLLSVAQEEQTAVMAVTHNLEFAGKLEQTRRLHHGELS